ncbi:MAG: dipicolinate synthase subunit B [Candidatus Epulonipiscium fishelsonii]|nr:MAG: dipicolinate synthase subunit B [Epulopiscium sp. AS2M-Bin002]
MKELNELKLGIALCGSFCTFKKTITMIENLLNLGVEVYPIMSFNAYEITTRFGKSEDFIKQIEDLTGREIIHTIVDAEPLGPKQIVDTILIAPCTGNTLTKIANSISDTPVTFAAKSVLRNNKPVIIAISTNDGLGMNLKNIGQVIYNQSIYFVPFGQDDPINKPYSLISNFDLVPETIKYALNHKQIQPILL